MSSWAGQTAPLDAPAGTRILVVEDEPALVRLLRSILEAAHYQVRIAPDGKRALEQVALEAPDLILLDLLLPGQMDGYEVCRRIREFSMIPVIMVTARAHEDERLRGFEAGADDYVTKPFSARELLARVKALLRRSQVPASTLPRIRLGELEVDIAAHQVVGHTAPVHLTPTEMRLLVVLARHANRVVPHTSLLTEVWGPEYRDEVDYLRTYVRYLRQKLEPDPTNPRYLITTPGVGYRLVTDE
ncbi:MAG TPA: response regulator transcription factor [Thermomicrobiales bacterium]|jgi:two-component system KDP operon response regulator KdpE|nr:DNA-binding response regulator [Chloroflexota bacterium]HBY46444.1 DNA-binding response regulator [Chloroflexota bacterium]HCG30647.1 DNA-binding response regulator [Chloroflexota bacterium]HQZ90917.1 response regulator transcription factor [Thermomicrobiales bacterium]HRA32390.1 response regulator transcription factor [Thermomicrobiales bacterium]